MLPEHCLIREFDLRELLGDDPRTKALFGKRETPVSIRSVCRRGDTLVLGTSPKP